ncbi:MAG: glycosyltransferase family 4 protein [Saprospiraceae bacterium]|nr:glycosyltransferase family 4 protein [Saprospiraceae bacterium]
MKVLQLCKKFPYPLKDGESIAVTYMSRAMRDLGCEITLLSMNTVKHYFDTNHLPDSFDHYKDIFYTEIDNRIKPLDAFFHLFREGSYNINRFVCPAFTKMLIHILEEETFDVIQLETLYMAPYIPVIRKHSKALIALRAHNVEHEIWARMAQNTPRGLKRWYLGHLAHKLEAYEKSQLNQVDLMVTMTQRDLDLFRSMGFRGQGMIAPIGIDLQDYIQAPTQPQLPETIGFIGSLDWMPNLEGLNWFLEQVWPKVRKMHPRAKLRVAGRNTPDSLKKAETPGVEIMGEVRSAIRFMNEQQILIVPLLSGSGMRVKILEGLLLGKTVITTTIGMEGIDARQGEEILLADSAEDFARGISLCLKDPEFSQRIGRQAAALAIEHFDHRKIALRVLQKYTQTRVGVHPE